MNDHLFGLQRQLDEYLLELFVHKVDAKLLEPVLLEDLEAVNVQNPQIERRTARSPSRDLHRLIDPL